MNVWHDSLLRDDDNLKLTTPVIDDLQTMKVQELMILGCREWDVELISDMFLEKNIKVILSIPLREDLSPDVWVWNHSKNCIYSIKSGYWVAVQLSSIACNPGNSDSWRKLWKLQIPPKLKIFLWRAARSCLPNRANL